ncbi:MAG: SusD/RagB family nutrient-binding outer membrane lipoprotein [Bacteroidales bacterium]
MKNRLLKYATALFTALLLMTTSCEEWIDPEINIDPDAVSEVPLSLLLSSIQGDIGYYIGDFDFAGTSGMWMNQVSGAARQAQIIGNYTFNESDVNNGWTSFYDEMMMDIYLLDQQAGDENPHFKGVGQVLMALSLGVATDLWNDIPYSEAFKGDEGVLQPAFDSQESIYQTIDLLLGEAVTNLGTDPLDNAFPLEGDMIYGGDTDLWAKAANALRARYQIHLSKRGLTNWDNVLTYCSNGFESNADELVFLFGSTESFSNPLYQFDTQRGDCEISNSWTQRLADDPRLEPTTTGSTFGMLGVINAPVPLMTYAEQKFIEAEAHLRKGSADQAAADAAYQAGVLASLEFYGVAGVDTDWETANITNMTGVTLQDISEAKYIHLFMQVEAFAEWRRTGYPDLSPTTGSQIPRRFPYATSERERNADNVPTGYTIFSRVWWDAE